MLRTSLSGSSAAPAAAVTRMCFCVNDASVYCRHTTHDVVPVRRQRTTLSACCCRVTARRSLSIETLSTAAQLYGKSHSKRLAIDKLLWRSRSTETVIIDKPYMSLVLVIPEDWQCLCLAPFSRYYHLYSIGRRDCLWPEAVNPFRYDS